MSYLCYLCLFAYTGRHCVVVGFTSTYAISAYHR
jgi:hypothetical protein